jgi:hypothetical protein
VHEENGGVSAMTLFLCFGRFVSSCFSLSTISVTTLKTFQWTSNCAEQEEESYICGEQIGRVTR